MAWLIVSTVGDCAQPAASIESQLTMQSSEHTRQGRCLSVMAARNFLWLVLCVLVLAVGMPRARAQGATGNLLEAARDGKTERLATLLQQGVNTALRDKEGYDAFDYAIERKHYDASLQLLRHDLKKAIHSKADQRYANALHAGKNLPQRAAPPRVQVALLRIAATTGDDAEVRKLLASGVAPDSGAQSGYTALALAARWGRLNVIETLLASGADANTHTVSCYQTTALMEAARDGSVAIARLLLAAGARVNEPDKYGDHALNWAAFFGHTEFAKLMIDHGADLGRTGQTDDQPIDIAMREGHKPLVDILLQAGARRRPDKAK